MTDHADLPLILRIVAYMCFVDAVWIGVDAFVIFRGDPYYSSLFGILLTVLFILLNILLGFGLLNLEPGWRKCQLVFCWIYFALIPFILFLPPLGFSWTAHYERVQELLYLAISIWTYWALTRPHVRRLFVKK